MAQIREFHCILLYILKKMRARFKSMLVSYLERTHQINIDLDFISHVMSLFFLYSVNLTEYVAIDARVSVCVSVYVSVCVISTAQMSGPILMKLSTNPFR